MNKSKILSFLLASFFPFMALSFMALSCTGGFAPEPDSPDVPVVPEPQPEPEPEPQPEFQEKKEEESPFPLDFKLNLEDLQFGRNYNGGDRR